MKRYLSLLLVFCMALVMICGCSNTQTDTTLPDSTPENTTQTTESTTEATTETTETTESTAESTTAESTTDTTTETTTEAVFDPETYEHDVRSIKILAVGNSFSVDAMQYLWDICNDAGIEEIILGNLYIGGCSLDTHWNNMQSGAKAYEFYFNDNGNWVTTKNATVLDGINAADWDYITVQQVSQDSGKPETFGNLQNVLNYINQNKTNKNAKIYWHMTWAYQQNSSHSGFSNYGKNQMTMYNAIVDATKTVMGYDDIEGIIPSGTAVQNLRTSYLGDALTRDGYHMSYHYGRYLTALTWFAYFTGIDIRVIDWMPEEYEFMYYAIDVIREAVNNAIANPLSITEAKEGPVVIPTSTLEMTAADRKNLEAAGKNPDDYEVLNLEMTAFAYYNSAQSSRLISSANSSASNLKNFCASRLFMKEDLPTGTVIVIDEGYAYRPEGWKTLATYNPTSRPSNTTENIVIVDDEWWGSFTYRAFNLSNAKNNTPITEEEASHLHIYIPKTK